MEREIYQIKTEVFQGPFALLLDLIEKRKFFINDLSLAQVTEDYINYVNNLGESRTAELSNFILVAATLILIKSKSLLPELNLTADEEGDIKSLEERLRLYELFNKLGINVKEIFGKKIIFPAEDRRREVLVFLPDSQITKESMMAFAQGALGSMPKKVKLPEVEVKKVVSIEEMLDKLSERIQTTLKTSFQAFAGKSKTREEKVVVIVSFLALLELVRQGVLNAIQNNHGEDIIIEKEEITNEEVMAN